MGDVVAAQHVAHDGQRQGTGARPAERTRLCEAEHAGVLRRPAHRLGEPGTIGTVHLAEGGRAERHEMLHGEIRDTVPEVDEVGRE